MIAAPAFIPAMSLSLEASRTFRVRFSSPARIRRWWGWETESHEPGACDLSRLRDGAAVLLNHDVTKRCGVTADPMITPSGGECIIKIARSALGDEVLQEIQDGMLKFVSVCYLTGKYQLRVDGDGNQIFHAIKWEPLEISLVSVPADPNCCLIQ
jgi:phage head maturation protease